MYNVKISFHKHTLFYIFYPFPRLKLAVKTIAWDQTPLMWKGAFYIYLPVYKTRVYNANFATNFSSVARPLKHNIF